MSYKDINIEDNYETTGIKTQLLEKKLQCILELLDFSVVVV